MLQNLINTLLIKEVAEGNLGEALQEPTRLSAVRRWGDFIFSPSALLSNT